jgi:hypothetical protein
VRSGDIFVGRRLRDTHSAAAAGLAGAALIADPASAATTGHSPADHRLPRPAHHAAPVFVQTDNTAGNAVVVYDRNEDGTLTSIGSVTVPDAVGGRSIASA